MAKHSHLPKYNELLNPLFQGLHDQIAVNSGPDRFSLFTFKQESTADLTPFLLVEAAMAEGCRVVLWFLTGGLSPALQRKADHFFDLEKVLLNDNTNLLSLLY